MIPVAHTQLHDKVMADRQSSQPQELVHVAGRAGRFVLSTFDLWILLPHQELRGDTVPAAQSSMSCHASNYSHLRAFPMPVALRSSSDTFGSPMRNLEPGGPACDPVKFNQLFDHSEYCTIRSSVSPHYVLPSSVVRRRPSNVT